MFYPLSMVMNIYLYRGLFQIIHIPKLNNQRQDIHSVEQMRPFLFPLSENSVFHSLSGISVPNINRSIVLFPDPLIPRITEMELSGIFKFILHKTDS